MRLLTVPNWSFGRQPSLLRKCRDTLAELPVSVHYCSSDRDHNRTVTAFSGEPADVMLGLHKLAELLLPSIDLNRHMGVHPRIGGLDVCPFVVLTSKTSPGELAQLELQVDAFCSKLSADWNLPIYLYEASERGRHESDLPTLRKGGFGSALERVLKPDFGPDRANRFLGVSIVGRREFLLAANFNWKAADAAQAHFLAKEIRTLRREGDPVFIGVRSLGFYLSSRKMAQLSVNLTLPDSTSLDQVAQWLRAKGVRVGQYELIGVIREVDLARSTYFPVDRAQVVQFD